MVVTAGTIVTLGAAGFVGWLLLNQKDGESPIISESVSWREYEVVGANESSNVEFIIQTNRVSPDPEDWNFRAAQRTIGQTTASPFAGKTQAEAFDIFGRTESTEAMNPGAWGVPLHTARRAAEDRLDALAQSQPLTLDDSPTADTPPDSTPPPLPSFPDAGSGSYEGFPLDEMTAPNVGGVTSPGYDLIGGVSL